MSQVAKWLRGNTEYENTEEAHRQSGNLNSILI